MFIHIVYVVIVLSTDCQLLLLYILCTSNAIDKILVSRGFTPRYTYKICVYLFSKENPS